MATNRQINYQVNLSVNKTGLNELNQELDKIIVKSKEFSNVAGDSGYADPFQQAADAAMELKAILNSAWDNRLNQLDLSKVQKSFKDAYGNAQDLQTVLNQIGPEGAKAFQILQNSILGTQIPIKQTSEALERMAITFKNTIRYGLSSSIFNNLSNSIRKAYDFSKDLNKSLNDIRIVSGESAEQMEKFAKQANSAAQSLGATTLDYTNAALIYYQQGLENEDIIERTNITIKMANVLDTSASEVSDYMTAIWNNFADGSKSLEYYADVITKLGAETASSAEEISDGLEKFAAVADTVGLSYEYATAALATVTATTRQSADIVGTSFKTLFARIQGLSLGETLDDGTTLNKYSEALKAVGISIKDQHGELKKMDVILDELGSKWGTLNKDQQVALAQTVAGVRQYNQLISLMDNWDFFEKNLGTVAESAGTLEKEQNIYLESNKAHIEQLHAQWQELYMNLFDTDVTNTFVDVLAKAVSILNNFVQGLGGGTNTILYLGSLLTGVFNQQLGASIARITNNINAQQAAIMALNNQIELLKIKTDDYNGSENTELQKKIELIKQINEIRNSFSEKEYKEITDAANAIAAIDGEIKELEELNKNINRIDVDIKDGDSKDTIRQKKEKAFLQRSIIQEAKFEENALGFNVDSSILTKLASPDFFIGEVDKVVDLINEGIWEGLEDSDELIAGLWAEWYQLFDFIEDEIDNLKTIQDRDNNLSDDDPRKLADAQRYKLQDDINRAQEISNSLSIVKIKLNSALLKGEKNITLEQEDRINLYEAINRTQNHYASQQKKEVKNQELVKNGVIKTLEVKKKERQVYQDIYDKIYKTNKAQDDYGKRLVTISTLTSSFQALSGIMNTITNPNMDAWDKVTSIISVGIMQAINLYKNWDRVNEALGGRFAENLTNIEKFKATLKSLEIAILGETGAQKINNIILGENGILTKWQTIYTANLTAITKAKGVAVAEATLADKAAAVGMVIMNGASKLLTGGLAGVVAGIKAVTAAVLELILSHPLGWILLIAAAIISLIKIITSLVGAINKGITESYERSANAARAMADQQKELTDELINTAKATQEMQKEVDGLSKKYKAGIISANEYRDALYGLAKQYGNTELALAAYRDNVDTFDKTMNQATIDTNNKAVNSIDETQNTYSGSLEATLRNVVSTNEKYKHRLDNFGKTIDLEGMVWRTDKESAFAKELKKLQDELGVKGELFSGWGDQLNIKQFSEMLSKDPEKVKKIVAKYSGTKAGTQLQTYLNDANISNAMNSTGELTKEKKELQKQTLGLQTITNGYETTDSNGKIIKKQIESVEDYQKAIEQMTNKAMSQKLFDNKEDAKKWAEEYITTYSTELADLAKKSDLSNSLVDAFKITEVNTEEIKNNLQNLNLSELAGLSAVNSEDPNRLAKSFKILQDQGYTTAEAMKILGDTFKNTKIEEINIDDATKELIDDYGTTTEVFKDYVKQLQKLNPELEDNEDEAKKIALMNARMNKGLENLIGNYEDLSSTIKDGMKNGRKDTFQYMEAMSQLKDITADILNLDDENALSDSFFESAENLELLKQASEGSVEAIEKLRQEAGNAIIQDIKVQLDDETAIEAINQLDAMIDNIPIEDLTVGAYVDLDTEDGYKKLNDFIKQSGMTSEQVQNYFNAMGYDPEIDSKPVQQHLTHNGVVAEWNPKTQKVETHPYTWEEDATIQVPIIKSLHYQGPVGKTINFSNTKAGIASKNNGSKNEPDKMEHVETDPDRYHKVDTQIAKVENSLSKLQSQQEKFLGSKLINNLNQQWELLNTQIENYNEKLKIANDEQNELAEKLKAKGVSFNTDGTINNYVETIKAQEAYVNNLIDNYNSMSKEQQESYKETIEQAQKDFEDFQANLNRYDELVSDFIPGLKQEIQDALDEQIEINIQKFNMELEITLDMNQATRDWNEWVKRAIDGIDPEEILGNAQAKLKDFSTYFNEAATANIQVQTQHLNDLLGELYLMDNEENSIFGDNRAKAIEELKDKYTALMQSITDVIELQDELYQAVLDEMDEVQEKFDKQISSYEFLRDLINHDMKVIELTVGEEAYGEMSKFYEAQQNNYEKQLDFQRQQKDFWYAQMQAAEEGSKEWDSAREKWESAVSSFNSILEEGLENAASKFENTINNIFKKLNNTITGGMGLDYVETQWDLINQNADRYLDTINSAYAIRELEKKYTDSINNTDMVTTQQRLKKLMDEQLANLKEKERLTQYDVDRANRLYEIELARIALEEAQRNKSQMRLRRDSQGNYTYQYVADEDAISEAENKLSNLYNDLYNFDRDRYNTVLNDIYDIWNNYQQAMAEAALINDPELRAEKERLIQEQYNELMMQAEEDYQVAKYDLQESFFWDWVNLNDMTLENFQNLTDNEKDIIMTEMVPTWENGIKLMAEAFSGPEGFAKMTQDSWYEIKDAENEYAKDMKQLEVISGQTFDTIIKGEDDSIIKAEQLIKDNKELIDAYENELIAVQNVYEEVKKLREEYEAAEKAAIAATKAAYEYAHKDDLKNIQDLSKKDDNMDSGISEEDAKAFYESLGIPYGDNNITTKKEDIVTKNTDKTPANNIITKDKTSTPTAIPSPTIIPTPAVTPTTNNNQTTKTISAAIGGAAARLLSINKTDAQTKDSISAKDFVENNEKKQRSLILKKWTFKTGGYTGNWNGENGHLAMLHKKELVLNANDTKNMLNSIAIVRAMTNSLGANLLSKLANTSANRLETKNIIKDETLEQNVHIDAQFPNVRNAAEIEEALNNLVNAASQRVNEK